jgi:hypothetical protein
VLKRRSTPNCKRFRNIKSAVAKQQKTQFPKWRYLNSRVKETIALAETWQKQANALMTQWQRSRYLQLALLQPDPKNKILITKLIELWNGIKKAAGFWQPRRAALLLVYTIWILSSVF